MSSLIPAASRLIGIQYLLKFLKSDIVFGGRNISISRLPIYSSFAVLIIAKSFMDGRANDSWDDLLDQTIRFILIVRFDMGMRNDAFFPGKELRISMLAIVVTFCFYHVIFIRQFI